MADTREDSNAPDKLIVEFKGSRVWVKRANGGPSLSFTHQEWHDIKMGKYDPQKKKSPPQGRGGLIVC